MRALLLTLVLTATALAVPHGSCARSGRGPGGHCRSQGTTAPSCPSWEMYRRSSYYYGLGGGGVFQGYGNSQPNPKLAPGKSLPGYDEPLKTTRKDGVLPGYQKADSGKTLPGY